MTDYIERETLVERLERNLNACNPGTFSEACYRDAIETVKNIPSADVVEVVRCKGCLLRGKQACAMYYRCCGCGEQHSWETDDDFCSWGIKKNERAAV